VNDATLAGRERTNNVCEGWNHAFANMVGHHHPSLWCLLGALQQDQALAATALLQDMSRTAACQAREAFRSPAATAP